MKEGIRLLIVVRGFGGWPPIYSPTLRLEKYTSLGVRYFKAE